MEENEFNENLIREAQDAEADEPSFEGCMLEAISQWFERMGIDNPPEVEIRHSTYYEEIRSDNHALIGTVPHPSTHFGWEYAGHEYTANAMLSRGELYEEMFAPSQGVHLTGIDVEVFTSNGMRKANTREELGRALLEEREGLSAYLGREVCSAPSWMDPRAFNMAALLVPTPGANRDVAAALHVMFSNYLSKQYLTYTDHTLTLRESIRTAVIKFERFFESVTILVPYTYGHHHHTLLHLRKAAPNRGQNTEAIAGMKVRPIVKYRAERQATSTSAIREE